MREARQGLLVVMVTKTLATWLVKPKSTSFSPFSPSPLHPPAQRGRGPALGAKLPLSAPGCGVSAKGPRAPLQTAAPPARSLARSSSSSSSSSPPRLS